MTEAGYRDNQYGSDELLDDLNAAEQLALVGLVRAVIRADGVLGPEEAETLRELVPALGEETFFKRLAEAEQLSDHELLRLADTVERQPSRELIYDVLVIVARAGTVKDVEQELLDRVAAAWSIDQDAR